MPASSQNNCLLDAGRYGLPVLGFGILRRSTAYIHIGPSRDTSHILWVVFTSITIKVLEQGFPNLKNSEANGRMKGNQDNQLKEYLASRARPLRVR